MVGFCTINGLDVSFPPLFLNQISLAFDIINEFLNYTILNTDHNGIN